MKRGSSGKAATLCCPRDVRSSVLCVLVNVIVSWPQALIPGAEGHGWDVDELVGGHREEVVLPPPQADQVRQHRVHHTVAWGVEG
jgi:hypothetical protein